MRNPNYCAIISILLFSFLVISCETSKEVIVGVQEAHLYETEQGGGPIKTFNAGEALTLISVSKDNAQVKTAGGETGWIEIYTLCSPKEFERRKSAGEIPDRVVGIVYENGHFYLTGGTINIGGGRPTAEPGQAFWMGPSTMGRTFKIGSADLNKACLKMPYCHRINFKLSLCKGLKNRVGV